MSQSAACFGSLHCGGENIKLSSAAEESPSEQNLVAGVQFSPKAFNDAAEYKADDEAPAERSRAARCLFVIPRLRFQQ